MKKINGVVLFLFVVGLMVSVYAQSTVIVGTVYEGKPGAVVGSLEGVSIDLVCGVTPLSDVSITGGVYGFETDSVLCNENSPVRFLLQKDGYDPRSYEGVLKDFTEFDGDKSVVVDFFVEKKVPTTTTTTSGGGSSGGGGGCSSYVWSCADEWSVCTEKNQKRVCTSNCGVTKEEVQACTLVESEVKEEELGNADEELGNFFSSITGAAIGTPGRIFGSLLIVLLIGILVAFTYVRFKKDEA